MVGTDIKKALADYLKDRLNFGHQFLLDMGPVSVKKVPAGPGSKISGEVVAVFIDSEVRDTVRRAARELGGLRDAGIRLGIPQFLKPSLQALESVSYSLKMKNEKIKRNIKFDDSDMDLVLDFNVDPEAGGTWKRVSASQAKAMKIRLGQGGSRTEGVSNDEL